MSAVRRMAGAEARACDCHALEGAVVCAGLRLPGCPGFTSRVHLQAWFQADPFPSVRPSYNPKGKL